nr:glucosaminidase domain-containing protein [Agrobacterium vitis]
MSQWIVESARGTSDLAKDHLNFGGIMYRDRMEGFATPVTYIGSNGLTTVYCKFASVDAFIKGYWHFISSGPYDGWNQYTEDAAGYIRHIGGKYVQDPQYVTKVQALFKEALELLGASTSATDFIQAGAKTTRLAVVVGHNSVSPGAYAVSPLDINEYAFNTKVADGMVAEAGEFNIEEEISPCRRVELFQGNINSICDRCGMES